MLVLPTQEIGKANEHVFGPGTLSFEADLLVRPGPRSAPRWRKPACASWSSSTRIGGNVDIMSIVARELRVRHAMMVVSTQWGRFGLPDGLLTDRGARLRHPWRRRRELADVAFPARSGAHG